MIDFHTHVLPGMDDGAKDKGESAALTAMLKEQGVDQIVLTPHFYPDRESMADFLERRSAAYLELDHNADVRYWRASETYLADELFSYDSLDALCVESTRVLLLELPYEKQWSRSVYDRIDRLIARYGIKPVIAHAERYEATKKRRHAALFELIDIGCLLQFDADSLIDRRSRGDTRRLIRDGWLHIVGSDCHSQIARPPRFGQFMSVISKKPGREYMELLQENARNLLKI